LKRIILFYKRFLSKEHILRIRAIRRQNKRTVLPFARLIGHVLISAGRYLSAATAMCRHSRFLYCGWGVNTATQTVMVSMVSWVGGLLTL